MARIRSIKPEFWEDELVASWPMATRLAYIALWNEADDAGRLRASPAYLRSRLFPYDLDLDMEETLRPLADSGRLVLYRVEGQTYGFLPKFSEHQVINRPKKSRLPAPPQRPINDGSVTDHGSITDPSLQEGKGKEQGRDHSSSRDDVTATDFGPDDLANAWNEIAPPECPRVTRLTDKRRAKARQRLRENPEAEFWREAIESMHERPFLRGGGPRGWRADFDWFLQPDSAVRVLEGAFMDEAPDRGPRPPAADGYRMFDPEVA